MLLIAVLLPIISTYNIDTEKYVVLEGESGEFGFSLATSSDRLFVGAPKDNKLRGSLYTCPLGGICIVFVGIYTNLILRSVKYSNWKSTK